MKRVRNFKGISVLMILTLILLMMPGNVAAEEASETETVTFVHTNDVHGFMDVEPYVKSVADYYKEENGANNVITASAGDVFGGGQAIAHLTDGEAVRDVMNAVGYDVMTIGNNDVLAQCGQVINFYNGYLNNSGGTNFPILGDNLHIGSTVDLTIDTSSNSYGEGDQPLSSYEIFTTEGGTRIGIFGVGTYMADLEYYTVDGTIESAGRCVAKLEEEGVDIIVGLIHTGWVDDLVSTSSNDVNSYQVAMAVDGIDLIIDGHSHSIINNGAGYVCDNNAGTLIVQASGYGGGIGIVNLKLDSDGNITEKSASLLSEEEYKGYGANTEVLKVLNEWVEEFEGEYKTTIGYTKYFLNGERAKDSEDKLGIRLAEQNLGNLVTDAFRYGIAQMDDVEDVDVVLFEGGRIRASIAAGDITRLDLMNVFANGGTLCIQEMTGAELQTVLKESVKSSSKGVESADYKQVSGLSFTYDTEGNIVSVTMGDGSALAEESTYRVAWAPRLTGDAKVIYDGYYELADALQVYLNSEVYANSDYSGTEGRINLISAGGQETDDSDEPDTDDSNETDSTTTDTTETDSTTTDTTETDSTAADTTETDSTATAATETDGTAVNNNGKSGTSSGNGTAQTDKHNTTTNKSGQSAKTGDSAQMGIWIVLLLSGLTGGAAILMLYRRRHSGKNE